MIHIVGLGTGNRGTLTLEVSDILKNAERVTLQTGSLDVADYLREQGISFETLDDLYENTEDFDELTQKCAEMVLSRGGVFAIIGSVYTNEIVRAVAQKSVVKVTGGVHISGYATDACAAACSSVHTKTAEEFLRTRAYTNGIFVVSDVDNPFKAADVALGLQRWYGQAHPCYIYGEGNIKKLTVVGLLREKRWAYDSIVVVPPAELISKTLYDFDDLVQVIAFLRSEDGCPWDREQTHESLRKFLIEESYETAEAIDEGDPAMLEDELGDVALQVVLHSQIASEHGEFDAYDVMTSECAKMISRHTHVFGTDDAKTPEDVVKNWDAIKRKSKGQTTLYESLCDVPKSMSTLMRAGKILKKAANSGHVLPDVRKEIEDILKNIDTADEKQVGRLLLLITELLRNLSMDADVALSAAIRDFVSAVKD